MPAINGLIQLLEIGLTFEIERGKFFDYQIEGAVIGHRQLGAVMIRESTINLNIIDLIDTFNFLIDNLQFPKINVNKALSPLNSI